MGILGGIFRTAVATVILPISVVDDIVNAGENEAIAKNVGAIADSLDSITDD